MLAIKSSLFDACCKKTDSNFNLRVVGAIHTQSSWDIFSMAMWVIATSIYHRNRWFHKANHVPPCSVFSPASTVGDFATVCCSGSWGHYRAQHVAQSPWTSGIGGNILFFLIKVFEYRYLKLQTPKHYLQKSLGFRDREKHIEWNCFLIKVFEYRYLKLQTPKHYLQKSLGFRDREKHIEWNCFLIKVFTYRYLKL